MPLSATLCKPVLVLSEIVRFAVRRPVPEGVKTTLIVVVDPPATWLGPVRLAANSVELEVTLLMLRLLLPVLVMVNSLGAPGVFSA